MAHLEQQHPRFVHLRRVQRRARTIGTYAGVIAAAAYALAGLWLAVGIDGFAIAVCREIGVELDKHRSRSFEELEEMGEALSGFDLIVAMSPASQRAALELTRFYHLKVEYWPIMDPTGLGETRETKLNAYRQTRDQIMEKLKSRWGDT